MKLRKQSGGVAQLTQAQIDVLARVAQFKSSKEIARDLGISHHTVDQRIRTVIEKLGVESRADAARLFLAACSTKVSTETTCETLAYQLPDLDIRSFLEDEQVSPGEWNPVGDRQKEQQLNETQALYYAGNPVQHDRLSWVSVLTKANRQNDLTALGRTICIMLTMLLALLVVGALVGLAEGLSRLV